MRQAFFYAVQIATFGGVVYGLEVARDQHDGGVATPQQAGINLLIGFVAAVLVSSAFYWLFEGLGALRRRRRPTIDRLVKVVERKPGGTLPVAGGLGVQKSLEKRSSRRVGDHLG